MVGKEQRELEMPGTPTRRSSRKRKMETPDKNRSSGLSSVGSLENSEQDTTQESAAASDAPIEGIEDTPIEDEEIAPIEDEENAPIEDAFDDLAATISDLTDPSTADTDESPADCLNASAVMAMDESNSALDLNINDSDRLSLTGNPDPDQNIEDFNPSHNTDDVIQLDNDEVFIADSQANETIAVSRANLPQDVIIPDPRNCLDMSNIVDLEAEAEAEEDQEYQGPEEIELSGDEDNNNEEDVSLICMKRPLLTEKPSVDLVDILDSDEEFPVCLQKDRFDSVNLEEKTGHIKEFIENEGLAVIHSELHGLVLFHLKNVYVNSQQLSPNETRKALALGTTVHFYDRPYEGPEYRILGSSECINQAVVVWTGERPKHLLKIVESMDAAFWNAQDDYRKTFLLYLRGEVFLPLSFVRVKGTVEGYLAPEIGIISVKDDENRTQDVVFHADQVRIFRKPVEALGDPVYCALPVGLKVSVDARRIHIPGVENLRYQAVIVLAASWPLTPHATLLPGGPGSYAPNNDVPEEKSTYYYMELQLENRLKKLVAQMRDNLPNLGDLRFEWDGVRTIDPHDQRDIESWRQHYGGPRYKNKDHSRGRGRGRGRDHKNPNSHIFKGPILRRMKTKDEMDDGSEVGNVGSSTGSLVSGCSSFGYSSYGSRAHSRLSTYSESSSASQTKLTRRERNWYGADPSVAGALRVKTEVKYEVDENGERVKRFKREKN